MSEPPAGAPAAPPEGPEPGLRRRRLAQPPPPAQPAPQAQGPGAQRRVTMNFKDAEIEQVVKFISDLTGRNFILDEKVRGKITVISPSQLTIDEAYQVFQAILEVKGFTVVPTGKVLKIVATRDAKQTSIETIRDAAPPGDRYVTRILRLKFIDAASAASILAPLVSKDGSVVPYGPTNTLIITDAYNNIERLQEILTAFDVETQETVLETIRIQYASAETVAKLLLQAFAEKARAGAAPAPPRRGPAAAAPAPPAQADALAPKIIPDPRTNSLIIITDPDTLQEIRRMIEILDVEAQKGSGKINVYYLKYADADNIASVLTAISKTAPQRTATRPGQPGQPAAPVPPPGQPRVVSGEVSMEFEEPVQITADKTTNSLVIIATPADFELLRSVIAKLDVRRPQVLVEALIVEMSYTKSLQFGVEWRTTNLDLSGDPKGVVVGSGFGQIASATQNPLSLFSSGLAVAAVNGSITFRGQTFPNIGALVTALQGTSDANVLSTPHLLTTDNEEAEIVVSQNIPYQTSQKFDNNGNPINTFDYKDVGLTLRLTPQINDESYVKLKLFQEISKLISQTTGSVNAPSTTKRSAKTTVVVKDATTVIIGGMIQDDDTKNVSSVPCLGDLPVLGHLFKSTTNRKDKTNLLIFLTPHVIRSAADLEAISRGKQEAFRQSTGTPEFGPRSTPEKLDKYMERQPQ